MILQISIEHHLVYETCRVLHARCIGCRVGTVQCQMEVEVGIILLQLQEVLQIEHFVQGTCTIEVVHLAVCGMQRTGHVHDLCAQRSHTGTTTYPNHFLLRIEDRMEISVRTTHGHLVTRFQREDVRRGDTRHHILEAYLRFRFERRSGDTYRQHDAVAFSRIVGH